jgi:hypothetical protein
VAERAAHNRLVDGSNPSGPTTKRIGRRLQKGMIIESIRVHFLTSLKVM